MRIKFLIGLFIITTFGSISNMSYANNEKTHQNACLCSQYSNRVYICGGPYATKFHSRDDCRGLNNCQSDIYYYNSAQKAIDDGYDYCAICWR